MAPVAKIVSPLQLVVHKNKQTNLPVCAGFTAVDVLGHGTMGHVIGVGAILALRVSKVQVVLLVLLQVEMLCFGCIVKLKPESVTIPHNGINLLQALGKI